MAKKERNDEEIKGRRGTSTTSTKEELPGKKQSDDCCDEFDDEFEDDDEGDIKE